MFQLALLMTPPELFSRESSQRVGGREEGCGRDKGLASLPCGMDRGGAAASLQRAEDEPGWAGLQVLRASGTQTLPATELP